MLDRLYLFGVDTGLCKEEEEEEEPDSDSDSHLKER
jgi:hypothetical protein